ncbi:MAG: clan AA aspartic protease [Thermoanaerobaculia bacterium]
MNTYREAVLRLPVRGLQGREQTVEAVLDTGFNGYLTLPPGLISALGLPFRRNGRAVLGDGSEITFDIHEAVVLWNGQLRRIAVDAADTEPLLGMNLLYGHELNLQVIEGGSVIVRPLQLS